MQEESPLVQVKDVLLLVIFIFAGMTLNKCAVLRIGMLTGGPPVQGESPPVQVKEPYSSLYAYL